MVADGEHIERGYAGFAAKLAAIGAAIEAH